MAPVKPKHRLFALEYLRTGNATDALLAAGTKAKTQSGLAATASRLLDREDVQQVLAEVQARAMREAELDVARVVLELKHILTADVREAFDDEGAFINLREWPEHLRRALAALEFTKGGEVIKAKFWSKTQAADKILRHLGGYELDNKQRGIGALAQLIADAESIRGNGHDREEVDHGRLDEGTQEAPEAGRVEH